MSSTKIFLVDDNAAHRSLVKRAIAKAEVTHGIAEAGSIGEARRLLFSAERPDHTFALLILDLNLIDGRSTVLMSEIRASESHRNLPILVLSTSSLASDVRESYDSGASCYITKAADMSTFGGEIGAAVRFLLMIN